MMVMVVVVVVMGAEWKSDGFDGGLDADGTVDNDDDADDAAAAADDGGDDYMPASPITFIASDVPRLLALLDNQQETFLEVPKHRMFPLEIDKHTIHQDQESMVGG